MRRVLLILSGLVLLGLAFRQWHGAVVLRDTLLQLQDMGTAGALLFLGVYALSVVLLIPGSLLSVGAGAVYGLGWGSLLVTLGALLGSAIAFCVARYAARDLVRRKLRQHPKLATLDQALQGGGLRLVFLLRLHPLLPYNLLNYALGASAVHARDYLLGGLGIIPGVLLFVGLGSLAGRMILHPELPEDAHTAWLRTSAEVAAVLLGLAVSVWLAQVTRKALQRAPSQRARLA